MSNHGQAAARVVGTLGVSDYVSVIEFNNLANHLAILERADDDNKKKIIEQIYALKAPPTYAGFELAFKIFGLKNGCHKAILFLSDGQITGGDTNQLFELISRELEEYSSVEDRPVIFTYSFGSGADSGPNRSHVITMASGHQSTTEGTSPTAWVPTTNTLLTVLVGKRMLTSSHGSLLTHIQQPAS